VTTKTAQSAIRVIVGIAFPLAMVVLSLLPLFLFRERLPDALATHWGNNRPNDSMSFAGLVIFILVFVGVPAGGMLHSGLKKSALRAGLLRVFPVWAFASSLTTIVSWQIVRANLDVPDWHQARPLGLPAAGTSFGVALGAALFIWVLARQMTPALEPEPPVPSAHLQSGERGVWVGSARGLWAEAMVYGGSIAGVFMMFRGMPVPGFFFLVIVLPGLAFRRISVTVDRNGVKIAFGPFMPAKRIPLGDIGQARCIHVEPMEYGGWGYRGSLRFFSRLAIVVRRGPGIALLLKNDKKLIVTVDDAETGAGLVNDLIAQDRENKKSREQYL